jgi:uncharacterized membrane protein YphA (DoxX/SURF4 family)
VAQEVKDTDTRLDRVGKSGIYPASGPWPAGHVPIRGQGVLAHPEERRRAFEKTSVWLREEAEWRRWPGNSAMLTVGRAVLGGFFIYNAVNHFMNRDMLTAYAKSKQVPAAELAVPVSGALLLLGGVSVLTGMRPKIGASFIGLFLAGVTPKMHDFWAVEDPQQRTQEVVNFTKNVALLGAAFLIASIPEPWPASVRA